MDLSSPIRSIIPSGHGAVLAVLARTEVPMSGRRIAELTAGGLSQKGTNNVLAALADAGVVLVDDHPPAKLYRLNREHLAAEAITALAGLRSRLIESMRRLLGGWDPAPEGAWLFGSAARGDGSTESDIDVLVVRPDGIADDDPRWSQQVDELAERVTAWSGNPCSVIECSRRELDELVADGERLVAEVRRDGIRLAGDLGLTGSGSTKLASR